MVAARVVHSKNRADQRPQGWAANGAALIGGDFTQRCSKHNAIGTEGRGSEQHVRRIVLGQSLTIYAGVYHARVCKPPVTTFGYTSRSMINAPQKSNADTIAACAPVR